MSAVVAIDGQLSPLGEGRVPITDRGFLYGDSAFEVVRTYDAEPFALAAHLGRLEHTCRRLEIQLPVSLEQLAAEVGAALAASYSDRPSATPETSERYIRVVVSRGTGPLRYDPQSAGAPLRVIMVAPLPVTPDAVYRDGLSAVCLRVSRLVDDPRGAGTKASNYLPNLLAGHEARRRGAEEAIITGIHGEVLEAAAANLFVVRQGVVRTPPLGSGILAGVTRARLMELCRELGIACEEDLLFPRDLYHAEEIFLTSTIREVVPVVNVDGPGGGLRLSGEADPAAARPGFGPTVTRRRLPQTERWCWFPRFPGWGTPGCPACRGPACCACLAWLCGSCVEFLWFFVGEPIVRHLSAVAGGGACGGRPAHVKQQGVIWLS